MEWWTEFIQFARIEDLIYKVLLSQTFWVAASALGTLAAARAALIPLKKKWKRNKQVIKILREEFDKNMQIIRNMQSMEERTLPGPENIKISAIQNNEALRRHISLEEWERFKHELTEYDILEYQKLNDLNRNVRTIVQPQTEDPKINLMLQIDAAKSFVKKYDEYFGEIKE